MAYITGMAKTMGEFIREKRGKRSATDLAHETGVSENTVYRWERDERSPRGRALVRLADALGVHPRELTVDERGTHRAAGPSAGSLTTAAATELWEAIQEIRVHVGLAEGAPPKQHKRRSKGAGR